MLWSFTADFNARSNELHNIVRDMKSPTQMKEFKCLAALSSAAASFSLATPEMSVVSAAVDLQYGMATTWNRVGAHVSQNRKPTLKCRSAASHMGRIYRNSLV